MSSNNNFYLIGAGLIGIMGAVSVFLVEHFRQEKRRQLLTRDLTRIDRQLADMRHELEQLRTLQRQSRSKHKSKSKSCLSSISYSRSITHTDDYKTASDIDSSDLEFYDLSDDEFEDNVGKPYMKVLAQLDSNLDMGNKELILESITILNNLCSEYPDRPELLYRLGKCYYHLAVQAGTPLKKQESITRGIELCRKALELNDGDADIHKWFAILIGMRSDFQSTKERITDGYLFKEHIEIAIQLSPNDAALHHMMGRFKFTIAGLKWFERKMAAALFGEPPNATYDEALECFLNADRLSKKAWKENEMFVGKCYIFLDRIENGVEWLQKASNTIDVTADDSDVSIEITSLLQKYGSSNNR